MWPQFIPDVGSELVSEMNSTFNSLADFPTASLATLAANLTLPAEASAGLQEVGGVTKWCRGFITLYFFNNATLILFDNEYVKLIKKY